MLYRSRLERNVRIFLAVAMGLVVFIAGFASYAFVFPNRGVSADGVPLQGFVTVKAYHPDGVLFATWSGHNSLTISSEDAMALCLSGNSSTPNEWSSCVGFTPQVYIEDTYGSTGISFFGTGTNTLLPSGCAPTGNPPSCDGWKVQGVVTANGGTFPQTLTFAGAAGASDVAFDGVATGVVTVNSGDIFVVSISFTFT